MLLSFKFIYILVYISLCFSMDRCNDLSKSWINIRTVKCIMRRGPNIENRLFLSFLKQGGPPPSHPNLPPPIHPILSTIPPILSSNLPILSSISPTSSIHPSRRGLNMRRGSNTGHFIRVSNLSRRSIETDYWRFSDAVQFQRCFWFSSCVN